MGMKTYRENLDRLFQTCRRVLKPETLFIWTTALPVSESIRGGVMLKTIDFLSDVLRYDVLLANEISSLAAVDCGLDVVDLHFEMRRHIDMRLPDGIHWNPEAHRKITGILLHHVCFAWKVVLPPSADLGFNLLFTGSTRGSRLLEVPADNSQGDVGSEQRRVRCGNVTGDGLLPTPQPASALLPTPQPAFARRGRQVCRAGNAGNRALSAPSVSVCHDENNSP